MKKLLLILFVGVFIFAGCNSDTIITPEISNNTQSNAKTWLKFENTRLEKDFIVSKTINGAIGGRLDINNNLGSILVTGNLVVPQWAFQTTENIQITFDQSSTYAEYKPSYLQFDTPLILTLKYTNVNLNNVNPNDIDFYYVDDFGKLEKVQYDSKTVDVSNRVLEVVNARIPHFSRYGWAK